MAEDVKRVEILGESYKLIESSAERFDKFDADGFCEWWAKEIHIKSDIGVEGKTDHKLLVCESLLDVNF